MENYKRGLTAGIPIALGYLSVSFTFGIMAAIAILYPWKFVPEYGILQMTESGEKAGKTAESQESDEEYMQVADRAVEALFTGDTDTLLSLLPERYFGQYGDHRKCSGRGTSETAR
mgnify:CR=1 FL=1